MRFMLLFMLVFLSSTGCKRKSASDDAPKIQKNSAFKPVCGEHGELVPCASGSPACGTKPGSGELKVYCIDEDDTILPETPKCTVLHLKKQGGTFSINENSRCTLLSDGKAEKELL